MADNKKLYVGNIPHSLDSNELNDVFKAFGEVSSCDIIIDRETRRSKGFGFVEMASLEEAQAAIDGLNGTEVSGRPLTVNEARPKKETADRGFGGGNRY